MITMINNKRKYSIPCILHQSKLCNRLDFSPVSEVYWDQLKDQFMATDSPLAWICGVLNVFGG